MSIYGYHHPFSYRLNYLMKGRRYCLSDMQPSVAKQDIQGNPDVYDLEDYLPLKSLNQYAEGNNPKNDLVNTLIGS